MFSSENLAYIPAAEPPLSVFQKLPEYNITTDEEPESIDNGQLVIANITDLSIVSQLYNTLLEKNADLIGGLSGMSCTYSSRSERSKRAAANDKKEVDPCEKAFCVIPDAENKVMLYASVAPSLNVRLNFFL